MDMARGEKRLRCTKTLIWKLKITICKIRYPMGICSMAQETQIGTLHQPRGVGWGEKCEEASKGRGHMYTYG